jgi:quinoprotein glucose dehydrogenase
MRARVALALGAALASSAAWAQPATQAPAPGDWTSFARDLAGDRYSPLDQINAGNVAKLTTAWSFRGAVSETTPLAIDGVLYLPVGNAIVAMDGATGQQIWRRPVTAGSARRSVSYWPGDADHPPRLYYSDGKAIVALDMKTGETVASFGQGGRVALDPPDGGPPTVYKDVLIIGASVAEMPIGPSGDTRAFDAVTGQPKWVFHTVARPGEPGHETWLDNGWSGRSGTNVWVWYMTADPKSDTLYMSVGGPSPNYYGGDRPGANLFGNSIVAVQPETGKLKWWFQTIHHDLWDSDLPAPPTLVDIHKDGKTIPALAETGKPAFMYILNRETGKPVFGVKETPVPHADVPGEWYSPTQPFPVKPGHLVRSTWTPKDVVTPEDTNAEHSAACHALLEQYGGFYNGGPFTPFYLHQEGGPVKASIRIPSNGGSNWGGTAADPRTGLLYINISEQAAIGYIEKRKQGVSYGRGDEDSPQPYDRASLSGPGAYTGFNASFKTADGRTVSLPCIRPPWGRLYAINANTGEVVWQTRLGVSDDLPAGKQDTGRYNELGGPIVTAGGLVFIGGTDDHRFRAFDSRTGKELWTQKLEYNAQSLPISYRGKDGRQYVAVVAAGGIGDRRADGKADNNQALIAFALPN